MHTTALELRDGLQDFLDRELGKELLRFTTAGSVDDGKSTLIGRLLHDCKAVYEDQLASVKKSRVNRSGKAIDFSLITDGLRAEREQGITIDVAYRYFSTARRKFIIADTPGHEQYTRNMATGASTADLAVILIDASKGLLPQTRRHAYIASLLGITHVLAAVNKMDLVGYDEEVFARLRDDFTGLATRLGLSSVRCVPVSALEGDNLVTHSENTPWYSGPTLLEHLENVPIQPAIEIEGFRFPVQSVIRPDASFRGFAGRIANGIVRPGDEVLALPSRRRTKVESIVSFDRLQQSAFASESVTLKLADEIDLSRGDLLVSPDALPHVSSRFLAMVVWLHASPLELNKTYLIKHAGRYVKAKAMRIRFRVNINTLEEVSAYQLEMNEIGAVEFEAAQPLFFDPYQSNRTTGSFVVINPLTNATVGAAMISEDLSASPAIPDRTVGAPRWNSSLGARIQRHKHRPAIFSFSGAHENAQAAERVLLQQGFEAILVTHSEIPESARPLFFATLWNLGLVILSWQEQQPGNRERDLFRDIAGDFYFDNSNEDVVRVAQTLRLDISLDRTLEA
ncbi:MAG TPA: sulfate adenylyltransferase subunit CysN [Candidatus Acidoferrum sp.]|nr:sulfate adenylyltransferase subunit CysN [Candidatus Acidoferrum sp.]